MTASESEILALYRGLGRDYNGRALVTEEEAMIARLRRLGYRFYLNGCVQTSEVPMLECWGAIAAEEAKYRIEEMERE